MSRFSLLIIYIVLNFCTSCKHHEKDTLLPTTTTEITLNIDTINVNKKELHLNPLKGIWYYKQVPFNGYAQKFHPNGTLAERIGFYNGKKQGIAKTWSTNGVLRVASHYHQNRLHGDYKSWWENGTLGMQAYYTDGKKQGVEAQWYATGQKSKQLYYVDGHQNGMQKAWLKNGKLYVNYEAKHGRTFGLMRANSCYKLEDENVIKK